MNKNNMIIAGIGVVVLGIVGFSVLNSGNNTTKDNDNQPTKSVVKDVTPTVMTKQNIVEIASASNDFSTLVTAIKAADLVETLSGDGPFTVFAPTNAAFDKLPAGTLDSLLADKEELTKILTYHVVSGKVMSTDVVKLDKAKTVQGSNVMIEVVDGEVMINDSKVTSVDIEAENGVIHVIDTVLLPQ